MTDYNIKFTDQSKAPINVAENSVNNSATDITLFGRKKLEYGRDMNANFLHILENFACPEKALPAGSGEPDTAQASFLGETNTRLLSNPIEGQLWYNITQETLFIYDGTVWLPLSMGGDIAANWGVLNDGGIIPRPVNKQGYLFKYDECSWIVSPFAINSTFSRMECRPDVTIVSGEIRTVRAIMKYVPDGGTEVSGCANYMIVGIKGNINLGEIVPLPTPTPQPSLTPAVTPSMTSTPAPSLTPSVTSTPGASAPAVTPTPTGTPGTTPAECIPPATEYYDITRGIPDEFVVEDCPSGYTGTQTLRRTGYEYGYLVREWSCPSPTGSPVANEYDYWTGTYYYSPWELWENNCIPSGTPEVTPTSTPASTPEPTPASTPEPTPASTPEPTASPVPPLGHCGLPLDHPYNTNPYYIPVAGGYLIQEPGEPDGFIECP